ncbi:nuclear GTPase SLIP-GC isoform X2 [Zootoca vivipara]|uniref:nuclear GTPase SLIP-GC isoform X2 n=1 Tax=Zootoca vivipara TaxID=8524 RepID=UPI00293BDCFA|nr:nuclear GTPase SLIP-GC isoform X2 [Zootoca vivipara]
MPAPCQPCGEGRRLCHLRRIGRRAAALEQADLIHFPNTVTLVGRSVAAVDFFLSSAAQGSREYISRIHARVIRTAGAYELVDSSLTGVYINDIRISEKVVLQEGDTVTFGHPCWKSVKPGSRVRQPNSPFYYLFEPCSCNTEQIQGQCGERRPFPQRLPALASAGASVPASSRMGFAPTLTGDPPGALPGSARQRPAISNPTRPGTPAASFLPPATSSASINSLHLASSLTEAPGQPTPGALPFSAPGGAHRPGSLRSASPGEGSRTTAELSPWRSLEATHFPFSQGSPESKNPSTPSGSEETIADDPRSGISVSAAAGLPEELLQVPGVSQVGGSELPVSSTEEMVPGDSDHAEERREVDMDQGTGDTAGPDPLAASGMEIQSPREEHQESFREKASPEASGWAENRASNFTVQNLAQLPAKSGEAELDAASRASEDFSSSGEETDSDLSDSDSSAKFDSERESAALLPRNLSRETRRSDDEISLQGWASESGDNMEMEAPHANASLLAMDSPAAAGDGGFLEPEMGSGDSEAASGISCKVCIAKRSYTEVGTQTESAKRRKLGVEIAEPGRTAWVFDDGSKLNTGKVTEGLLQQLPGTSADNEHAKGEFSQQVEKDPAASSGATQEILASGDLPETREEGTAGVAALPSTPRPLAGQTIPEESVEMLGDPVDVEGKHFCRVISKRKRPPFEEWGEGVVLVSKRRMEHVRARSDRGPEDWAADSVLEAKGRKSENDGLSLGTVPSGALVVGWPGGSSCVIDGEMECQEEMDKSDLPEGREVKREGTSVRAAGGQDEASGEGGLERDPSSDAAQEEMVGSARAEGTLQSLGGNWVASSPDSAGRKTREFPSPERSGDDLEEVGIPHIESDCANTQASCQASEKEAGRSLEPKNGHILVHQGGIDSEDGMDPDGESAAEAQECGVGARCSADGTKVDPDPNEPLGTSALLECQQGSPAPGQRQLQPHGAEPEDLEGNFAVKPQGTDVGRELLYPEDSRMEGSVWEEACEGNGAAEQADPERAKGRGHSGEEGGRRGQTPESCHCTEGKGSLLLDTPSAGSGSPGAGQGGAAGEAPRESQMEPAEVPNSFCGRELSLLLSDSEVEKEEDDRGNLRRGRSPLGHSDGVSENHEACRKLPEESPAQESCDASAEPLEGSGMLGVGLEQNDSSHNKLCCDPEDASAAVPQTPNPEVAVGGKSPPSPRTAVVEEELEDRAVEGADLVAVRLACLPAESPCLAESDAKFGAESPGGLAEDSGSELVQDNRPADDEFPGQPGGGISGASLEVGETIQEYPGCETPASRSPGEEAGFPKGGAEAPLLLHQEMETVPCPGDGCQREGGSAPSGEFGEAFDSSGHGRRLLQEEEEEESKASSSRKRHFSEDQAAKMTSLENDSLCEERLCPLDPVSVQASTPDRHPLTRTPPAPLNPEGLCGHFGGAAGKPPDQHDSQATLSLGEAEEKNGESFAQKARGCFENTLCSNKPASGNEKAEELPLPCGAETAEGEDCQSAEIIEAERCPSSGEPGSPEEEVSKVRSQDLYLDEAGSTPGALSGQSGHLSHEQDKDTSDSIPESVWDTCFSEEESFQLSPCSGIQNSPPSSPAKSPEAESAPSQKNRDFVFSDISNSSADSLSCERSPRPPGGDASGAEGDGLPKGGSDWVGKGAKANMEPDSSSGPEMSDMDWFDEDPQTPSHQPVSPRESTPTPSSDPPSEPDYPISFAPAECDPYDLQEEGGTFEGEGVCNKAPSVEGSGWAAPSMSPTTGGEEEEEEAVMEMETGDLSQRQPEESALLQRSPGSSTCQGMLAVVPPQPFQPPCSKIISSDTERDLGVDPPSALLSAGARRGVEDPQGPPYEEHPFRDGGGNLAASSPSSTTSVAAACEPASCPMLGDVKSEDLTASCSSTTQASNPGEHPLALKRPGSPLPSSEDPGSAGMAESVGKDPEQDLISSSCGAGWEGQEDSSSPPQEAPGDPLLVTGGSACSPSKQKDGASALGCWVSQSFKVKEEKDPCDPGERQGGPSCDTAYPTACSPVIKVLHQPKASANRQPEGFTSSGDFGNRDRFLLPCWLEEAELSSQLDTERVCSDDESVACPPPSLGSKRDSTMSGDSAGPSAPREGEVMGQLDGEQGCSNDESGPCPSPLGSEDTASSSSKSRGCPSAPGTQAESGRWPYAAEAQSDVPKDWASCEQDVEFQLQECQSVLGEILRSLESLEGIDWLHMEKWREQVASLQKATQMPQTHIAVVGNTGAGKSCLLNALLDEEAVLPTSAMRACTAVVVEVSRADGSSPYEADVEFLSREEWDKELKALLEDMKDKFGHLKRRCPDRKTEAGAAYSRVKAVYGRVDELEKLEEMQEVTQHLGTVKHICAETATEFRATIERFIDSRTDNLREMKGGEFWPIVKCVRIRLAKAEVLKTGAVLVDLPGIRDANAARDSVAKEYLKNCCAVWVVASITRAVDDKTAKETLSASVRRQLLMDGLYGSLAFVCTKSDSFNITDIVRNLDLRGEIQLIEDELRELDNQKMQAEGEKERLCASLQQQLLPWERPGCDASDSKDAWLQRRHDLLEKEFRISALQRQKEAKLREISLICVRARNKYSKQQIQLEFSASLEDMTRKAASPESEEDGDEDLEEGDAVRSESGNVESLRGKLPVFTVSSTEYLKLCGKLIRDGQPQVFHDPQDTEIPALKAFAIRTALKHSMGAAEKLIRDLARVLSQIVNYLTSQRAETDIQESVWQSLQQLPSLLQEAIDCSLRDTRHCLEGLLFASLAKGTSRAKELCQDIVRSWGCPVNGYPHATYRAACNHHGLYASPTLNCVVDFNSHLTKPIWETLAATWNEVFNCQLKESIQGFAAAILDKLRCFFKDLRKKLRKQSRVAAAINIICRQQMEAAGARLLNFTLSLMDDITARQRSCSRILTPEIRTRMEPAYAACTQMSGPGYFQRMKSCMEDFIRTEKHTIFDSAANLLQERLKVLQQHIGVRFQDLAQELQTSLIMQLEPLLKPVQKNAKITSELMTICAKVDKICRHSCVSYNLPCSTQGDDSSAEMRRGLQGSQDPPSSSATCMDARIGTISLAPMQVYLCPYGQKKRAGELLQPQLEKKHKGQAAASGAGGGPAGIPSLSYRGTTMDAKPGISAPAPGPCRGSALEGCQQESGLLFGAPQPHVPVKVDSEQFAIPGSAGVLRVWAKEGIWGKSSTLSAEKEEASGNLKTEKMETGPPCPASATWMTH